MYNPVFFEKRNRGSGNDVCVSKYLLKPPPIDFSHSKYIISYQKFLQVQIEPELRYQLGRPLKKKCPRSQRRHTNCSP